jgi:hypothetical protein
MALRCRRVGAVHSIIFDRFNVAFAMSDYPPEAEIGTAGIYEYTP